MESNEDEREKIQEIGCQYFSLKPKLPYFFTSSLDYKISIPSERREKFLHRKEFTIFNIEISKRN
jgi:hypothetical protein